MSRLAVSCFVLLASLFFNGPLCAESRDTPLISPRLANHHGMERAWFTQLRLDPGAGGVEDLRLHVSSTSAQTIFRVISERGPVYSFSNRDLNPFGERLGEEGAKDAAAEKARLLRLRGIESRTEQAVVPDIVVYVTTHSGLVHAIDAETGRIIWTTGVGSIRYPTTSAAATDTRVAVVNGQHLFVLDASNGAILEDRRVLGGPPAGPAIVGDEVFVPLLSGQIRAYEIGPDARPWVLGYHSLGRVDTAPTVAGDRVVWANTTGDVTVVVAGKDSVQSRFRLDQPIAGHVIFVPPHQIVAVTRNGVIYSFDLQSDRLMWRYASGCETREPVAVVGGVLYFATRDYGMFALSAATGESLWPQSYASAKKFLAASSTHVFCISDLGHLATLDAQTGHPIGRIPINMSDQGFSNMQTDRAYIVTESGVLQCLHELGADLPTLHLEESPEDKEDAEEAKPAAGEAATSEPPAAASATESPKLFPGEEVDEAPPEEKPTPPKGDENPFE